MVHTPAAVSVTVADDTEQIDAVSEEKLTGSPELAVAESANDPESTRREPSAANAIV